MKKVFTYSAIVLLLATSVACNKTDSVLSGVNDIRFAIASPATRALVENDADLQKQEIQVFDLLDGANYFAENETVKYVESDGLWKFQLGNGYTWKTGTHTFFAFTNEAGTINLTDTTLAVSKTLTAAEANQVDIVYSNVVAKTNVEAAADSYKAVPLTMDHLFAAVAINVVNCTSSAVTVTSVSKPAIPNKGSADVHFGLDTTIVNYGAVTASGAFVTADDITSAELASNAILDVLGRTAADAPVYYVVWPQEIADGAVEITVNYAVNGNPKNATISLPASVWEAGNKYRYNLNIYPTQIKLTFVVQPWDVVEVDDIDTSTGSINMSNVTWQNSKVFVNDTLRNTLVNSDYAVYMFKDAYKAVASKYAENVYQTYEEDVYQTYEEDVYGEDGTTIIHHQGDPVLDDDNNPIIIHHQGDQVLDEDEQPILIHKAGDPVLDENGEQVYVKGEAYSYTYVPAQGFFTVNYPNSGLFKITLIQASYWNNPVPEGVYEIWIYDSSTEEFRKMKDAGETITNDTVYFQVRATSSVSAPHVEYRAQIDILFKPADDTGSTENSEWISAYSEIRANYACVIKAE